MKDKNKQTNTMESKLKRIITKLKLDQTQANQISFFVQQSETNENKEGCTIKAEYG